MFVATNGRTFALLRSNGRWLVETHTIALAPSATILQLLRPPRTRAAKPLLALAVPEAHPGHNTIFDGTIRSLGALIHLTDEVQYARHLTASLGISPFVGTAPP